MTAPHLPSYAAYFSYNLRNYLGDWSRAQLYLRSGDTVIGGLHFTDQAMAVLRDRDHPDFRKYWTILLFRIMHHHPYLFHATDGAQSWTTRTVRDRGGQVSFMTVVPKLSQYEYELKVRAFKPRFDAFMQRLRKLTAGRSTMETALITVREIAAVSDFDYTYQNNSIRHALMEGTTMCWGTTGFFNTAMHLLGYRAEPLFSWHVGGGREHAWSALYVPERGRWVEIDATWMNQRVKVGGQERKVLAMQYFDFSSKDSETYAQHHCTEMETVFELTDLPRPGLYGRGGIGYQFPGQTGYVTDAVPVPGGGIELRLLNGSSRRIRL